MASLDREDAENDEDNFKSWGVEKLKSYLLEREVPIGNTNKQGLINLAVFAIEHIAHFTDIHRHIE